MGELSNIARQFSQRSVMEAIIQCAPISRASISKQTGLSKQTVSEVVRQLEEGGWVRETGLTSGHVGRAAVNYELIPDAAYILAVDLGGTKVRVAISDLAGHVSAEEVAPTLSSGGQAIVDQIADLCAQAVKHQNIPQERLRLAVVGVPGAPDAHGSVLLAPNIPGFDTMDVAGALEAALGVGVILENDVNLAVVGESWLGEGQDIDDLAYVAVGTGIGSGLIVGGNLVRGAAHAAGELGFLPFGADPFDPESLRSGAFERVVASIGIKTKYRELSGHDAPVSTIIDRSATGEDPHAEQVLNEVARYLARGLGAIAAIANPQKIIIGGSIGLRPELVERIRHYLPLCFPHPVEIGVSSLGAWAAIAGGTAIGLRHLHNALFGVESAKQRLDLPPSDTVQFKGAAIGTR